MNVLRQAVQNRRKWRVSGVHEEWTTTKIYRVCVVYMYVCIYIYVCMHVCIYMYVYIMIMMNTFIIIANLFFQKIFLSFVRLSSPAILLCILPVSRRWRSVCSVPRSSSTLRSYASPFLRHVVRLLSILRRASIFSYNIGS